MKKSLYELTVCVNGRPVREFGHNGTTFIEGREKQPYTIKFRNNSSSKVLAIISVDGMDVVDGKPATSESRGYIIPAYQSIEVKGWRTSLDAVNEFVFDDKPKGYATQSQGTDINCGIVAVKVIEEKRRPILPLIHTFFPKEHHHHHHHHHHYPFFSGPHFESTAMPLPDHGNITCSSLGATGAVGPQCCTGASGPTGAMGNAGETTYGCVADPGGLPEVHDGLLRSASKLAETPDFNLGTGWGKEVEDSVNLQTFERGIELETLSIYYTDAAGLRRVGIDTSKATAVSKPVLPQGFNGFCVPPKVTSD